MTTRSILVLGATGKTGRHVASQLQHRGVRVRAASPSGTRSCTPANAAVAIAALTEDGHAGQIYQLSEPRLLSFGAAVKEIAEATGRNIRYVATTRDPYLTHAVDRGMSPEFADVVTIGTPDHRTRTRQSP